MNEHPENNPNAPNGGPPSSGPDGTPDPIAGFSNSETPDDFAAPPQERTVPGKLIEQSELDALFARQPGNAEPEASSPDEFSIDAMLGDEDNVSMETQLPRDVDDGADIDALLTHSGMDDLLAGKGEEEPILDAIPTEDHEDTIPGDPEAGETESAAVGAENLAAGAVPELEAEIAQDLLDSLIAEANLATEPEPVEPAAKPDEPDAALALGEDNWNEPSSGLARAAAKSDAIKESALGFRFRLPAIDNPFAGLAKELPKIAASLIMGVFCSVGVFSWLALNQDRLADPSTTLDDDPLRRTVDSASSLIDDGLYDRALMELEEAIASAPNSNAIDDAAYLQVKAKYLRLPPEIQQTDTDDLQRTINDFVETAPAHPRMTEVLRWQGDVYDRIDIPLAALDVYNEILNQHSNPLAVDEVLFRAGKTALNLDRPQQAIDYFVRLRQEFPVSTLANEAALHQGDAYRELGETEQALTVYRQVAVSNPATRIGAQAYARLAQVAFDEGAFDEAIEILEQRLATATTTDGNEDAYLLLAKSYRATGDLEQAERVLRELTQFFPENERTPEALVELSRVLEARGNRPDAINVARQAAQRHPENPLALENAATFLAQAGDPKAAAETLLEADQAGGENAALLLQAARHYASVGELKQAEETYLRLLDEYGDAIETFEGRIELARVYYDRGKVRKAVEWLDDLAVATAEGPRQLPVLVALADIYDDLGVKQLATPIHERIAGMTGEPELLAQAATQLLQSDNADSGLAAAQRVDIDRLSGEVAYPFLIALGTTMRSVDPARALDHFERAYTSFPNQRTTAGTQKLLDAYLAAERTGAARAVVMDLEMQAKADPLAGPALRQAAVTWGDHLYERRDYRAAADAYQLAMDAVGTEGDPMGAWATYQRANALLAMRDLNGSVPLFEEVAATQNPWSEDARVRQAYAEVEQRLAHEVPPPRESD